MRGDGDKLHDTTSLRSASASTKPTAAATPSASATPAVSAAPLPTPEPPAGWVSYHSTVSELCVLHPPDWQPFECNGVTAVDNVTPICAPGEGPPATLTVFNDQGLTDYTGTWPELPVSVNGVTGRCFTDMPATQTPAPDNGPVLAYSSYTVCDVPAGARVYHFTFFVPPPPVHTPMNAVTPGQFEQFLQTVTFDG